MSKASENGGPQDRMAAALERIAAAVERMAESSGYPPGAMLLKASSLELLGNEVDSDTQAPDKRRHPRKPCSIVVDYATQDRAFRDYIRDISKGGVFIETKNFFSLGQEFIMTFSVPNHDRPLKFIGEVVRTDDRGVGVRFKKKVDVE